MQSFIIGASVPSSKRRVLLPRKKVRMDVGKGISLSLLEISANFASSPCYILHPQNADCILKIYYLIKNL